MNLCSKPLFLLLTNSHATAQLSTPSTSETVLLVINAPLTHTFSTLSLLLVHFLGVLFLKLETLVPL